MADSAMVNLATGKGCHRDRSDEAELVVVVAHGAETAARSWRPARFAAKVKKR